MYVFFILLVNTLSAGQDCANLSYSNGPFTQTQGDTTEHLNGSHGYVQSASGGCTYAGHASTAGPVGCSVIAKADSFTTVLESGSLNSSLRAHYGSLMDKGGLATAGGGASATADADGAVAIQSCILACGTTIGMNGTGQGTGFVVTFNPLPLWAYSHPYVNACPAKTLPKRPLCDMDEAPYNAPEGYYWVFDPKTCRWSLAVLHSPVIVDTTGNGFHMSDPNKNWVTFDLQGNGTFERFSWPTHGSGNAWLVYDANDDGVITNGKELFGNFTPHSDGGVANHPNPNGFLALAWYDKPAQGGNWDGIIDKQDAIWNHLKLWIDNHCYLTPNAPCASVPSEVHSLESAGIKSISLIYQLNPANDDTDTYGNEFKIYVPLNVVDGRTNQKSTDPRVAYDVFLRVADQ